VTSGVLIREARLRAGLTQADLATRVGRDRSHVARWERGAVSPSFETLQEVLRACGWELSTALQRYEAVSMRAIDELLALTPAERLARMIARAEQADRA
jgi:transcriptional regulator with XRE-family HTH domain